MSKNFIMRLTITLMIVVIFCLPISAQKEKNSKKEVPKVELHGALRYNYKISSWKDNQKQRGGDFGFDMLAFSPKAHYKGLTMDFEYRFYASEFGNGLLRRGDIAYSFNESNTLKFGLTKVPFGIEPYNSHSYYLSMGYYMGFGDNYDMGVKWMHTKENFDLQLAFFKNAEEVLFGDASKHSSKRYSYDIVGSNKKANQLNGKFIYKLGKKVKHRIGASAMFGGLYNIDSDKMGKHNAWALHYELNVSQFNLKAQTLSYDYSLENLNSADNDMVSLGAYNLEYNMASKGKLHTLGVSYNIPVEGKVFDNIQFYNDYNYFDKSKSSFEDSTSNTFGILIHAGNIYSYVEYIIAENQPWFGSEWTNAFSTGNLDPSIKKEKFFNINIGYYF